MASRRKIIQAATAVLCNSHLKGFFTGKLYRGNLKNICVPGLNCYSCPGAVGACPIGSLQAVAGNSKFIISYYVIGLLALFGLALGRAVCAFLCPFGLVQELLHKIPVRKIKERPFYRALSKLKYVVLLVLVLGIPIGLTIAGKISMPTFCQYLCPAGTLQAGLPMLLLNPPLRTAAGPLFFWKAGLLAIFIVWSVVQFRPFCRFFCPLGAIYSLFNKFSFIQIDIDGEACTGCGACTKNCKMQAKSVKDTECIRCGECVGKCPQNAMCWKAGGKAIGGGVNGRAKSSANNARGIGTKSD